MGAATARVFLVHGYISLLHRDIGRLIVQALEDWKWDAIAVEDLPRLISFCEQRSAAYAPEGTERAAVMQFQWRKRAEALLELLRSKKG